jgi:hypothetical protein
MPTTHLPKPLIESLKKKRCVLFVGSGLSTFAGFPSWQELIDRLVEEARLVPHARTGGLDELIAENDLLALAGWVRSTLGKFDFDHIMRDIFDRQFRPDQIPDTHRAIVSTDYRAFVTTNYDRLIEDAFYLQRHVSASVMMPDSVLMLATALYESYPFVLKLHGSITAPPSIVLTEDDYDRLVFQTPHLRLFLHALSLSYTLLFVGYSLTDPDFRLILKELKLTFDDYSPPRYALVPDATDVKMDALHRTLNIQTIPYCSDNHHQAVVQLLEELQQIAPYS